MKSIEIAKLVSRQKKYLTDLSSWHFDSLLELVFDLFLNHEHGQSELMEIEYLLEKLGYSNLNEIPKSELAEVYNSLPRLMHDFELKKDSEWLSYSLLAAICRGQIMVVIDEEIIKDPQKPISVHRNSFFSFIDTEKLNNISFKTL